MQRYLLSLLTIIIILAILGSNAICQETQSQTVEKWGMFETSVDNAKVYANPFRDVIFHARFTSPSKRNYKAEGFYDGDNTWRLRFMPDEVGEWKYVAIFTDGTPGIRGTFKCIDGKCHGPLKVCQKNMLWFELADKTPFYMSSFHIWQLDELGDARMSSTLDFLKGQGFNTIVSPHLSPSKRLPWDKTADNKVDFSRFNLKLWQDFDKVLQSMAKREMVLITFNVFGGTNAMPKIPTRMEEDLFLHYWVARWGGYWNATYQPIAEWEEGFTDDEVSRIGRKIEEVDGSKHLISIHSQKVSSDKVQREIWYSYHTVQDKLMEWDPTKYTWLAELFSKQPKPMLAHELLWEGNLYQKEAGLDMDNMRKGAWFIALSGGQINYADEVIAPRDYQQRNETRDYFSLVGTAMKPCGGLYKYISIINTFMRSIPFYELTLRPRLSSTGVCLTDTEKRYVTYTPAGGKITVDLTAVKGDLTAKWFNPREGKIAKSFNITGGSKQEFEAPDKNDWVLHIAKK